MRLLGKIGYSWLLLDVWVLHIVDFIYPREFTLIYITGMMSQYAECSFGLTSIRYLLLIWFRVRVVVL